MSAIVEIFRLAGDHHNHLRALRLLLKLSNDFDCPESKSSALLGLARHSGLEDSDLKVRLQPGFKRLCFLAA